jgi:aconitate hydratase
VIAKSFARIYRRNLISQGISCPCDSRARTTTRSSSRARSGRCRASAGAWKTAKRRYRQYRRRRSQLLAEYSSRKREILLAGGVLGRLRQEAFVAGKAEPEGGAGDHPNPEAQRG